MNRRALLSAATTVTAVTVAVSGCTTTTPTTQPSLTLHSGPIFTVPSPSPTTLSPEQRQVASADATVRSFIKLQDRIGQDASISINELHKVLRGTAFDTWSQEAQLNRGRGWRQVGDTVIVTARGTVAAKKPRTTVTTTICYDVSKVDVVDRTGKSVVTKDRIDKARASYTVEQYPDGWFITDDDTRGEPCGA